MASAFKLHRRSLLVAAVAPLFSEAKVPLAPVDGAPAAINTVADFSVSTWTELRHSGPRPAAYVFTTSYCPTCPEAFRQLQAFVAGKRKLQGTQGSPVELAAVLMDVQGARALAHAEHFAGATRLYAFDGFEPAIRQSVDPQWPNVTPYIVLVGAKGTVQRCIGPASARMLKQWLP
jgi:hypothetical protein